MPIQNVDISTSPSSKTVWQDDRTSGVFCALAVSNDGNVLCLSLVSICLYNGWQRTMNKSDGKHLAPSTHCFNINDFMTKSTHQYWKYNNQNLCNLRTVHTALEYLYNKLLQNIVTSDYHTLFSTFLNFCTSLEIIVLFCQEYK